jgi:hypothetical protein
MGFFEKKFNKVSDADRRKLTQDMLHAVYRGDSKHVEYLSDKGANFTEEMLTAAVHQRSERMVELCLRGKVPATLALVRKAQELKDRNIAEILVVHLESHDKALGQEIVTSMQKDSGFGSPHPSMAYFTV